jgi:hypothetical protein
MKKQYVTKQQQYEIVVDAVERAIIQTAEISGLRNWLMYHKLQGLKKGEMPNGEGINHALVGVLQEAFFSIIDPDDREYFASELYQHRDTGETFGGVGNPMNHKRMEYMRKIGREETLAEMKHEARAD